MSVATPTTPLAVPATRQVLPRTALRFLAVLLAGYLALLCLPSLPGPIGTGLDASWGYALNMAHAQHLVFGEQIIFTYGPLGYLNTPDPREVAAGAVLGYLILTSVLFGYGLFRCWDRIPDLLPRSAVLMTLAACWVWTVSAEDRLLLVFASLLLAVSAAIRIPVYEWLLLGGLAGLMLLVKVNDGVAACLLYSVTWWQAHRPGPHERWAQVIPRLALGGLGPVGALILGCVLAQTSPLSLWSYLRQAMAIAGGYSEAMSVAGPSASVGIGLVAIFAVLVIFPWVSDYPQLLFRGLPASALFAFFAWKHAMVRQDGHADRLLFQLSIAVLPLLLCCVARRDQRLGSGFALGAVVLNLFVLHDASRPVYDLGWQRLRLETVRPTLSTLASFGAYWEAIEAQTQAQLEARKVPAAMAGAIQGDSVDVMPHQLDRLRAHGWHWTGRPVIQSYAAYTPALDQRNAEHLRSQQAARQVLLEWDAIDGRQPLIDDAASWRALFDWYDLKGSSENLWLLERRSAARYLPLQSFGHTEAQWDVEMPVPAVEPNEFLAMKATIRRSVWGALRTLLFRADPVVLEATYGSGRHVRGRVTRANLVNGALVGHLPQSLAEVGPYFGAVMPGIPDRVTSVRWVTEDPAQYGEQIDIEWQRLRPVNATASLDRPAVPLEPLWSASDAIAGQQGADSVVVANALVVRPSTTDPQVVFDLRKDLSAYRTIVIRARFSLGDRVNLFFGRQVEGRGLEGFVPVAGQWMDIYIDMASNPHWQNEAGRLLRFDTLSERAPGATVEIAAISGSSERLTGPRAAMTFYPAAERPY